MIDDDRRDDSPDAIQPRGLKDMLAAYERALILMALDAAHGHQRRAAAALGVLPSTLSEKMRRLGIRQTPARTLPQTAPPEPRAERDPGAPA
jgi:DNA-binding NtrC family response regulator